MLQNIYKIITTIKAFEL